MPLKRHPALFPLSRQHHRMLVLAQLLKRGAPAYKGMPTDPEGKRSLAIRYFQEFIQDHFLAEEIRLIPQLEFRGEKFHAICREMKAEHESLTVQFSGLLQVGDETLEDSLDHLGHDLEAHVRKEEREWFMIIQETLSEEELADLALEPEG